MRNEEQSDRRFLSPGILDRVERLAFLARETVEGYLAGLHRSPYHGFAVEFHQHRAYVPGDEIRHIDWKVYARSERYYVKQYEEETNLVAHLLLDGSESMRYSSTGITKLEYGAFLVACLGYLILLQTDAAALGVFDRAVRTYVPPSTRLEHIHRVLGVLSEARAERKTDVGAVFHHFAERLRRRGVVVVISDLFDDVASVVNGLQHLRFGGHEVVVFHVLDPAELHFDFGGVMRFKGLEDLGRLVVEPRRIRDTYLRALHAFLTRLRHACEHSRIDYVQINTATPIDVALTRYLARRMAVVKR
jgi:uncharacterized protein (DUF58 family)